MNIADILRHKADIQQKSGSVGPSGHPAVVTVSGVDAVSALVAALAEHNVGAAVVVDGDALIGIASERDVVRRLAEHGADVLDLPVTAIMTAPVHSCSSDDPVERIAEAMTERRIRHMPVVDDGRLAGVVSIGDVVSSHIRQLEHDRGQLEQYISG